MSFSDILNDEAVNLPAYNCLSTDTKPTSGIRAGAKAFETDTNDVYEFDGAAWVKIRTTDPAGNRAINMTIESSVTVVSGTNKLYTLNAEAAAGSGDAAGQFVTDSTGFKGFTVDIIDDIAIAATDALMVAWSTSVNAEASLTTTLDALRTALGTPDGAAHSNCFIVTEHTRHQLPVILYNGTDTIKTISVASDAGDKNIVVKVIV